MKVRWKAQPIYESEMALFYECLEWCAHVMLDIVDIARDGDFAQTTRLHCTIEHFLFRVCRIITNTVW